MLYTNLLRLLTLSFLSGCATFGGPTSQPFVEMQEARTVRIVGEIGYSSIRIANQLMSLAEADAGKDINLLINSPGGMVMAGGIILQAMAAVQSRGIKINCVVPVYAASMAFTILHKCDRRYAFENSLLLFHPIRVGVNGYVTGRDAEKIAADLNPYDAALREDLLKTGLSAADIEIAYYDEKMWTARDLATKANAGYIILITDVHGLINIFQIDGR